MKNKLKRYFIMLPTWRQGDDLAQCIEENQGNAALGFADLKKMHLSAAETCEIVSRFLSEVKQSDQNKIEIFAEGTLIDVFAEEHLVKPLVDECIIQEYHLDDEDEDEYFSRLNEDLENE